MSRTTLVGRSQTGTRTTMIAAPVDLNEIRPVGNIRRPQTVKQPFSRLTDGIKHPVTVRRAS